MMMLSWMWSRRFIISVAIMSGLIFLVYCITMKNPSNGGARMFTWNETANDKRESYSTAAQVPNQGILEQNAKTSKVEPTTEDIQDSSTIRKRLPNAIIIGSAKAGTRALLVSLKMRTDVKACSGEVHFFDRDDNYRLGLEWYRQKMRPSRVGEITIEKSPAYFTTKDVPRRVHNMSNSVKLLVVVRDPTTRAISEYTQFVSRGQKPALPKFEKYVTIGSDQKVLDKNRGVIMSGVYIKHLRRWLKFFPLSQIHFVSGEELVENPVPEVNLVEKFLDLKPVITEANFYFNKTKGFHCFIGKIGSKGRRKSSCLGMNKGRQHVPVREDVRKLLQDYYRPFNRQLYEVVGRTFNWA